MTYKKRCLVTAMRKGRENKVIERSIHLEFQFGFNSVLVLFREKLKRKEERTVMFRKRLIYYYHYVLLYFFLSSTYSTCNIHSTQNPKKSEKECPYQK